MQIRLQYGSNASKTHESNQGPAKEQVSQLKRSTVFQPSNYIFGLNLEPAISSQIIGKDDSIYYGDYSGAVVRRNGTTGEIEWRTVLPEGGSVRATPLIYDNTLWIVAYDTTMLYKLNLDTGAIVLSTRLTDYPVGSRIWHQASGSPAIDEKAGYGYIGTGQSYNPPSSANACAVLKFELATGKIVHSYPFKPTPLTRMESCVFSAEYPGGDPAVPTANDPIGGERDLAYYNEIEIDGNFYGDNDVGAAPILYETNVNGVKQNVVANISKASRIRAFNRDTNTMLWERVITTTAGSNFANPGLMA